MFQQASNEALEKYISTLEKIILLPKCAEVEEKILMPLVGNCK
jgi:hypothetical protein